ncbi:hypothetical protein [Belnapia sp. F-4-1]|uniref:hypothetical protein n=1 Tax=Belnapia sp. F-4-1 TaxID=1545443 RepID=UPI0005BC5C52|nr:hypothetical protein [Belnapia sp. F-4-1]
MIITDDKMIDHQRILDDLLEVTEGHDVEEVVFGPARATLMMGQLMKRRIATYEFIQHARNYRKPMKHGGGTDGCRQAQAR